MAALIIPKIVIRIQDCKNEVGSNCNRKLKITGTFITAYFRRPCLSKDWIVEIVEKDEIMQYRTDQSKIWSCLLNCSLPLLSNYDIQILNYANDFDPDNPSSEVWPRISIPTRIELRQGAVTLF